MAALLLVEDDDDLRDLLVSALQPAPFRVVAVGSMQTALRVLASSQPLVAVATDFSLGDGTGAAVIQAARALRPHIAGLLITGHPAGSVTCDEGIVVLSKPFDMAHFRRAAAEAVVRGHHESPRHL